MRISCELCTDFLCIRLAVLSALSVGLVRGQCNSPGIRWWAMVVFRVIQVVDFWA